jgi:hypothetical protein
MRVEQAQRQEEGLFRAALDVRGRGLRVAQVIVGPVRLPSTGRDGMIEIFGMPRLLGSTASLLDAEQLGFHAVACEEGRQVLAWIKQRKTRCARPHMPLLRGIYSRRRPDRLG